MHHGILLEDSSVLHITPFKGRHRSTMGEFSKNKKVYASNHRQEVRDRTLANLDLNDCDPYNPFTNNCEHLVTRATKNEATSPQLRGWIAGIACAAIGLAFTRHPAVAMAGFALGKKLGSRARLM